jgi:DNA-binding CsgD family transcriptional regulator
VAAYTSAARLFGRERELGLLSDLIDRLSNGAGGALVISGEAGVGKSALLAAVTQRAQSRGVRIVSAAGVQSEIQMPFAGLHQLLQPLMPAAQGLPERLRAALLAAFGLADSGVPALFLIGLAALELIDEAAEHSPVLLAIDDAQWLDQPSCAVLAFVARRLADEQALMLAAVPDGQESPFSGAGLAGLRLERLAPDAAAAVLDASAPGLPPAARERLLTEAMGSPLALVELPTALETEHGRARALPAGGLPLTTRLVQAFAAQASGLPTATRSLLLAGAANDGDALAEALSAASKLAGRELTLDALEPAIAARLVEIDETRLRFRHPLMRAAVYQRASLSLRQATHAALAQVLAAEPDREVWHRAAAAMAADEDVASLLDKAAERAIHRGAVTVAMSALERAAELSQSPASRGRRLRRAAELAFDYGQPELSRQHLRAAQSLALPAEERSLVAWLSEATAENAWSGSARFGSFAELAGQLIARGQAPRAARLLATIALRLWWGNPDQQTRTAMVTLAARIPLAPDHPVLLTLLAFADPVRQAPLVVSQLARLHPDAADPAGTYLLGAAATGVWAQDHSVAFLEVAVRGLRAQGRVGLLVQALVSQAWSAVHLARQSLAASAAQEAFDLASEHGMRRWAAAAQLAQAAVAAQGGDFAAAEALVDAAEGVLLPMDANPLLALAQFALGHGAVAHGHYEEGFQQLSRLLDPGDPRYQPLVASWGLGDLIEAAIHIGQPDAARTHLATLESLAQVTAGPLLQAELAYVRPLAASDDTAETQYTDALEGSLNEWPGYRARLQLWYGSWLRRQRRAAESRAPLRAARDSFEALGLPRLADRARQELRAAGETSPHRAPEAWTLLTAQERQIARLAAEGLSNREIGQQLFISHRTVSYHLYQIFPKLGIHSRNQLQTVLTGSLPESRLAI